MQDDDYSALERFTTVLEWLMCLTQRQPQAISYGLIHVRFHDTQRLGAAYGAKEALTMLIKLASELRHTFRKYDLVAREGMDFWILVPNTTPDAVAEKVATLVELASDNGLDVVDRDVAVFSLPDSQLLGGKSFDSVAEMLAHLKQNRQIAYRWDHVYQPE
jgi:GGDEF domain-containing protein